MSLMMAFMMERPAGREGFGNSLPSAAAGGEREESRCAATSEYNDEGERTTADFTVHRFKGGRIMATRVRWLGHACLLIESDGRHILIDPFLTGNPAAAVKADEVPADFILISHGHGDHVGDAIDIARRTGATVVANYE